MEDTENIATILRVNFTFLERSGIRGAYVHSNEFEKMTPRSGPWHSLWLAGPLWLTAHGSHAGRVQEQTPYRGRFRLVQWLED